MLLIRPMIIWSGCGLAHRTGHLVTGLVGGSKGEEEIMLDLNVSQKM